MAVTRKFEPSRRRPATWHLARWVLLALVLFAAALAQADDSRQLVGLLNAYRQSAPVCAGRQYPPLAPLLADERLARASVRSTVQLQSALRQADYLYAAARLIGMSGPAGPQAAMAALRQRHCGLLLDPQYTEIGVRRSGNNWQLVLARPRLSRELGDWQAAGQEILKQINAARGSARRCGGQAFPAAPALRWNGRLAKAALVHSRDMAGRSTFSHQGRDGGLAGVRATREGYRWQGIGENIAAGQGTVQQVVAGWLASPSHCVNIMNPAFTEMGAAYAVNPRSDAAIYWTQVFGTPR